MIIYDVNDSQLALATVESGQRSSLCRTKFTTSVIIIHTNNIGIENLGQFHQR